MLRFRHSLAILLSVSRLSVWMCFCVLYGVDQIGEHIDVYEKRISEVKRCSDLVYAAQRSEGYEMSRFGSYLTALSVHEKRDDEMKRLAEVRGFET